MNGTKNKLWQILAIILVIGFVAAACGNETSPTTGGSPALTGKVSISGTAKVGQTLTAVTASLGGTGTISYQWKRGSTAIGTNNRTYQVQAADAGSAITVKVTRAGYIGSVTSKPTAAVIDLDSPSPPGNDPVLTGTVSITGYPQEGYTLTASTDNLNGSGTVTYQWKRGDTAANVDVNIGANSDTYVAVKDDIGKYINVTVTREGYNGSITSAAVGPVRAADAPTPSVTAVTVNPSSVTLSRGNTQQFGAKVDGAYDPAQTVTWAIVGTHAAETSINADGNLTVAADETAATLTIRATSTIDTTKSGTATVTVLVPTVTSVTLDPKTASVLRGETAQFNVTVAGTNSPAQTVNWSIVEANKKAGTTIDTNGLLTIASDETLTTLTVKAASTVDTGKTDTAAVTVLHPTVKSVTVSPAAISVNKGGSQKFTVTIEKENDPKQTITDAVTWTVTGGITGTSIANDGTLTVAFEQTASLTVTATSTFDTGKSGAAAVTVTTPQLTGTVTITGIVQEEQTLTANTVNLVGDGNGAVTYQWTSSSTSNGTFANISGAASSTYTLAAADVGKYIKLTVTRSGYNGSITSDAVGPVTAKTVPIPTVTSVTVNPTTATVLKGATQKFTATVTGTNNPATTVTWTVTGGVTGTNMATDGTLTVSANETAASLTVRAASTVDTAKSATAAVTIPALSGTVSITGTTQVGQQLTANTGSLNGSGTISYQWTRGDSATAAGTNISGATSSTYTLVSADQGKYIKVTVTRAGYRESVTSAATAQITFPALSGSVSISNNTVVGQQLSATTTSLGGSGNISYQWTRGDTAAATTVTNIGTGASYTLVTADAGKYIKVTITRSETTGSVTSNVVGPVTLPALTGTVTITGTAQVGQALSASTGSLGGSGTITYQWKRADSSSGTFSNITGATSSNYTLVSADEGKYIKVTVTRSENTGSVDSAAVGPVTLPALTGTVTITGTAQVGQTLTANTTSLGGTTGTISYQWTSSSTSNGTFTNITSATSSTYVLVAADQGKFIKVTVTRTGFTGSVSSAETAAVSAAAPTVTSVTVSPATASVVKGGTQQFSATVTGTNSPAQTVTWSIVETGKNSGTTINASGLLTVAAAETLTSLTVKATSTADTTKSGTATVTVSSGGGSQTFKDITAEQLVADIKIGWNLGNSLDATTGFGANASVAEMERGWGNPVTTKANITAIKNAGFNAVRIPVSWTKATNGAPNYIIRADWMARVKEVVNYAVDNDMYIILNTHHDENVLTFMNSNAAAGMAAFKKLWEQIADAFKDYNEKLIFEGLNEPRTIESPNEWNGGTPEERNNLNSYYPIFVNTVRSSGGNNGKRILMINPYAASATSTAVNALTLPEDTVANKLVVSIHAYTPYQFCFVQGSNTPNWSSSNSADTSAIQSAIQPAYDKFVSKGIPVIIGEFGAVNKNNTDARVAWAEYYVSYARSKGIPCFVWDNNVISGAIENFGLFNRSDGTFYFPTIKDALIRGANSTTITPPTPPATPTPPTTITGNLGNYQFGTQEDGVSPNYTQAVWGLSGTNLTTAKTAGAKLTLVLSSSPAAGMQFVWQAPNASIWWKSKDILGDTGNVIAATTVTWNSGTKTLTIPLSASSVEEYSSFTAQSSLNIIIAYYGGDNINALGIVSANLQQ